MLWILLQPLRRVLTNISEQNLPAVSLISFLVVLSWGTNICLWATPSPSLKKRTTILLCILPELCHPSKMELPLPGKLRKEPQNKTHTFYVVQCKELISHCVNDDCRGGTPQLTHSYQQVIKCQPNHDWCLCDHCNITISWYSHDLRVENSWFV